MKLIIFLTEGWSSRIPNITASRTPLDLTLLYKGNMESKDCRLLFEQKVSPWKRYFENMIIKTEDSDCQINRIFFYINEDSFSGRIKFKISPSKSIDIAKICIYKGIRNDF